MNWRYIVSGLNFFNDFSVFLGHSEAVIAVQFSPDGR